MNNKKWLQAERVAIGVHDCPSAAHREQNVISGGQIGGMGHAPVVFDLDGQNTAIGHGIARIGGEVEHHLLKLSLVCFDQSQIFLGMNHDLNLCAGQTVHHAVHFRDHDA